MRMRLRTAALLATTGALLAGTAVPATAQPMSATWSPDLLAGETAGIVVEDGTARLDHAETHLLPADADGSPVPTGLLTLPAHRLDAPTDQVETSVDGDLPAGSTASVDLRGRRVTGAWTEWIPAGNGAVTLPESVSEVQSRLVLTGDRDVEPSIRGLTLTAHPPVARTEGGPDAGTEAAALNYRVFATREGLAGHTTANGHRIAERDHFVALPSRRALSPRGTSDYSVKVCAPNGRCAFAPVWDVGPWNTRDDYWNPADQRQEWKDLPQGVPQAQAAHGDGYNGGRDQFDRRVANPAGIDLGDGLFWDALGLNDNSWVTVDYLWTGSVRLSSVEADEPVDVLAAPDSAAEIVGVAADRAAVPVECVLDAGAGSWLRIGSGQYVGAESVPDVEEVATCEAPPAPGVDVQAGGQTGEAVADDEVADDEVADDAPQDPSGEVDGDAPQNPLGQDPLGQDPASEVPADEPVQTTGRSFIEHPGIEPPNAADPHSDGPLSDGPLSHDPHSNDPHSNGTSNDGTGADGTAADDTSAGTDPATDG